MTVIDGCVRRSVVSTRGTSNGAALVRQPGQLPSGGVEFREHVNSAPQYHVSRRGEPHSVTPALEQVGPGSVLERRDLA